MDSRGAAPARAGWGRLGRSWVRNSNCSIFLQLVEAAVGDNVARVDSIHLRQTAVRDSRLYGAQMSDVVLNHIHERCLAILLNGGCWNQRHSLQRIYQQASIHKLVREERIIFIVEDGPC